MTTNNIGDLSGKITEKIQQIMKDERLIRLQYLGNTETTYTFTPSSTEILVQVIEFRDNYEDISTITFGDINTWDTSLITDMSELFKDNDTFNADIGNWNTCNVTNMTSMFEGATIFNQDLSDWNMRSVASIVKMFKNASAFTCLCNSMENWLNVDIINPELKDFSQLFSGASLFNVSLENWDTSRITNMNSMFKDAVWFNQDITSMNVKNVTDMSSMFYGASFFNHDIRSWSIQSSVQLSNMFKDATRMSKIHTPNLYFNIDDDDTPSFNFFNKPTPLYFWDFKIRIIGIHGKIV